jgi:hypothetical protein
VLDKVGVLKVRDKFELIVDAPIDLQYKLGIASLNVGIT